MKCTVIGNRGYVGRALFKYLKQNNYDVYGVDRIDNINFDEDLGEVFYCAGITGDFIKRPLDTLEAHIAIVSQLIYKANFRSFLYLSSTRVYCNQRRTSENELINVSSYDKSDFYNLSKLMGESVCLTSGKINVRVARLSNVVGGQINKDTFVGNIFSQIESGTLKVNDSPKSKKDYVLISDVVKILQMISFYGANQIYNVASGKRLSHYTLLKFFAKKFN
jgi:nucleoside-diphosphate-sugar epimerase